MIKSNTKTKETSASTKILNQPTSIEAEPEKAPIHGVILPELNNDDILLKGLS